MRDIDELIKYHNECEYLDFKREEYTKETMHNLVKDVLAFANADTTGDRYIIIGVHKKDGHLSLYNIDSKLDSANIQQKIHANISPEIKIEYFSHEYDNHNLMVLALKGPDKQPYMMSKELSFKNKDGKTETFLRANECWVRKGSYQVTANKEDYIRMLSKPADDIDFNSYLEVYFSESGCENVTLNVLRDIDLPSEQHKRKIEKIIKKREQQSKGVFGELDIPRASLNLFRGTTYEERDTSTLKENLKNIKKTYRQADYHYLFEDRSYKLNLTLLNKSSRYLEDASIELRIPKIAGLMVADKVYSLRETGFDIFRGITPEPPSFEELNYPTLEVADNFYVIREDIGSIKHYVKRNAFEVDLRIIITPSIEVSEVVLKCIILGKNNKDMIKRDLYLVVEH